MFQIFTSWLHKRLDLHKVLGKILTNMLAFHGDDLPLDRICQKITRIHKSQKTNSSPVPQDDEWPLDHPQTHPLNKYHKPPPATVRTVRVLPLLLSTVWGQTWVPTTGKQRWGRSLQSGKKVTSYKSWQPLGKTLLKVKLLVGPIGKIALLNSKGLRECPAKLRCAKIGRVSKRWFLGLYIFATWKTAVAT